MKALISEALAQNPLANGLQTGVLVLFVGIFSWILWRTFSGQRLKHYEEVSAKLMAD